MQKNTICINCGSIGHRVYDCEEVNSFTIEMGWGRYNNHQITSPYCQESTPSYNYCQESSCTSKIFSLETYCSLHTLPNEQNHLKSLVKEQTNLSNIQEVTRFKTNWNNNLATVIAYYDNYYQVFFLVYDNKVYVFPTNPFESKWGINERKRHDYLSGAENEASWLRDRMIYESNPILYLHPRANEYVRFDEIVSEPYVKKEYIGLENAFINRIINLNEFYELEKKLRILDIIWVTRDFIYDHVGIYIGNKQIIQLQGGLVGTDLFSKGANKTTLGPGLGTFLGSSLQPIKIIRPVVPFKNYKTIIQQLVWAKDNSYMRDRYNLLNRNCEHFANKAILGINFSQQVHKKKSELIALNVTKASLSGASLGAGLAGIALVPFTGGASLVLAPAVVPGIFGISRINRGEYSTRNNNKDLVNLHYEINNDPLSTKQDSETKQLEERYECQILAPIKIDDCVIM